MSLIGCRNCNWYPFTGGIVTVARIMGKLTEFCFYWQIAFGHHKTTLNSSQKIIIYIYKQFALVLLVSSKRTDEILRIIDAVFDAFKTYSKESLTTLNSKIPLLRESFRMSIKVSVVRKNRP